MLVCEDVIVEIRKRVVPIRLFPVFIRKADQTSLSGHAGAAGCNCGDPQASCTVPTFPCIHPKSRSNVPFRSCWCCRTKLWSSASELYRSDFSLYSSEQQPKRPLPVMLVLQDVIVEIRKRVVPFRLFPGIHPKSRSNVPFRSCWCCRM